MMPLDSRCSLLVLSCDAYADLWQPFFSLLREKWPDCPYPIFLGAGTLRCDNPGVTTLGSGAGHDWSRCVLDYLEQLPSPYVLVMLDDFFLRKTVESDLIRHCLNFAERNHAKQVRLIPRPGPTRKVSGEKWVGSCMPDLRYRVSTQAAIWERKALMELLRPGESAWQFEQNANQRASQCKYGYYAAWKTLLPYSGLLAHHVVEKGRWLPHEKWIFSRQSIGCDFSKRATLGWKPTLFCQVARLAQMILSLLPYRLAELARRSLRKIATLLFPRAVKRLGGMEKGEGDRRSASRGT